MDRRRDFCAMVRARNHLVLLVSNELVFDETGDAGVPDGPGVVPHQLELLVGDGASEVDCALFGTIRCVRRHPNQDPLNADGLRAPANFPLQHRNFVLNNLEPGSSRADNLIQLKVSRPSRVRFCRQTGPETAPIFTLFSAGQRIPKLVDIPNILLNRLDLLEEHISLISSHTQFLLHPAIFLPHFLIGGLRVDVVGGHFLHPYVVKNSPPNSSGITPDKAFALGWFDIASSIIELRSIPLFDHFVNTLGQPDLT